MLDIDVSVDVESRALRIMHAWLTALETRGFVIHINDEAYREGTTVTILGVSFMFRMRERLKRVAHDPKRAKREGQFYYRPPPWDLAFTGDLEIVVHCKTSFCIRTWKDTKREALDSLLNNIVLWMIQYAGGVRAQRAAEERMRQERAERERQRREAEKKQRQEQEREDALIQESEDWEASQRLRAYLAELKAKATPPPAVNPCKEVQEVFDWFEWAEGVANRLDPIRRLTDQTLRKGTL